MKKFGEPCFGEFFQMPIDNFKVKHSYNLIFGSYSLAILRNNAELDQFLKKAYLSLASNGIMCFKESITPKPKKCERTGFKGRTKEQLERRFKPYGLSYCEVIYTYRGDDEETDEEM